MGFHDEGVAPQRGLADRLHGVRDERVVVEGLSFGRADFYDLLTVADLSVL